MNSSFVIKMVKAEMLRYEAVKEILPECLKQKVDKTESEFKDIIKKLAFEIINENAPEKKEENKPGTRKISVNFDNED